MRRRNFILGGTSGLAMSLAGCLGYTLEETSDVEDRKTEISQLQSTVQQRESRVDDLESELEQIKNENSQLEDDLDTAQNTITDNVKDRITTFYESGVRYRDTGLDEWNRASDAYDAQNNVVASRLWAYAHGHYDGAVEFFFLAATTADNNGYDTAYETASSANRFVTEIRDAADDFSLAAYYYSIDDIDQGDTHIDNGNEHVANADNYTVAPLSEIEQELGV